MRQPTGDVDGVSPTRQTTSESALKRNCNAKQRPRFVQTCGFDGMTRSKAELLIAILNGDTETIERLSEAHAWKASKASDTHAN